MREFGPGDMPRAEHAFTTIQFVVSKTAADALDPAAIRAAAAATGLRGSYTTYERRTASTAPGKARITCSRVVAPFVIEAFRGLAAASTGEMVIAATESALAGLEALALRETAR